MLAPDTSNGNWNGNSKINALYFSKKLQAKLDGVLKYAFTFVEAPMGFGKTTAIRWALKGADCTVLWQTVFGSGGGIFWPDFCDAFLPLSPELTVSLRQIGLPNDIILIRQAVKLIQKVKLSGETALVIDDYHLVDSTEVDSFLSCLIANTPEKLHIVILSRAAFLEAGVAEMRLKDMVNYIGADTLKLDLKDVEEYYALCGVAISKAEQKRLWQYSEGWITPLYLLIREYADTGGFSAEGEIDTLVRNIVYNPLSNEIKEFLCRVCVFDSFTAKQAAFVWRRNNAEALLSELRRRNTFITMDAATGRYSFHRLFLSHVRTAFDALPEFERGDVWKRAGEYFLNEGHTIQAVDCFEKAGDLAMKLTALASRNGAGLTNEHKEKIIDCLDRCPDAVLGQNLTAVLVFIRFMISYNERARLARCIAVFENGIGGFEGADKNLLLMNYERFLSLTKYNDIAEMSKHHRKALAYMDRPYTGEERIGNWTLGSPSVLLMFHRESGKLADELEQMRECMPVYHKLTDGHGCGAEYVMEAEAAFQAGDFTRAESIIHKAQYYARGKEQWSILLAAEFLQMRLSLVQGDYFETVNIQRRMADLVEINRQFLLQHTVEICQSHINLLLGLPDRVADWIAEGEFSKTRVMFPALPALHIVYGRYLLARGEYARLCGFAEVSRQTSSVYPNLLGVIYADIYLAAAHQAMSREDEAVSRLKSALDTVIPDGIIMPFADNCGDIADIQSRLASEERYSQVLARILELHKGFEQTRKKILREHFHQKNRGLNGREIEVARLAAEGLSNQAIGERLFLSKDGVKSRLKSVFEKLNVTSRKQLGEALKL